MKNKILKSVVIITGTIAGIILILFISLYLSIFNKVLEAKYGTLSLPEKIGKFIEASQSLINTNVFKNAPACNAPEIKETVYDIIQKNDGNSDSRWINAGSEEGLRFVVGKLYYDKLNLYNITLEQVDKEAKKNTCAGTLTYTETLNENGAMGDDRKIIYTNYSCRISYETQNILDDGSLQVVLLGKECEQGDSSVEENLD